ncbi:UDP-N-acetylmuramoyl-tripeptide--D-alanyl-D-alanine ligase [Morganella psychrotolerans]|uniref:UDP-N-acetylmuramoyl-tripeptide--D-alanyl-D-alanine ligase n=1 Tax=Morganella psychrotolerans TaxID=368603 RepID=A0A1B8H7R0_9GAMM|nr:UDP-N-acetylmuramoyl-tripeptide--D-alanyl-D-alanine ligase [Morganella psychrotolerans]OBU05112.1 UDP-N-acetylmuramoyl-tripeptide--D-alanyl-D-alanine ligase [Morganella psychrotolerans]
MIPVSLADIAQLTGGELILSGHAASEQVESVTTDSRTIGSNALFIALAGEHFDAHDFIQDVATKGVTAVVVNRRTDVNCPQIIVDDTRIALGAIAKGNRLRSQAKVVALTGSSGKTSVKEMAAAILQHAGKTLFTAGNFNNDIGVPLTLLRLTEKHQFAVIELGANHIGEIAYTVAMTCPQTALVNNLFAAHIGEFGSAEAIAQAKGEIFAGLTDEGTAIINLESNDLAHWQSHLTSRQTRWCFSVDPHPQADFYATEVVINPLTTDFTLHTPAGSTAVTLALPGRHNIANALAAAALTLSAGATLADIRNGLAQVSAVPGRLYPIALAPGKLLVDDTYNANDGSLIAAIRVLAQLPGYRILVTGDIAELGEYAQANHRKVGQAARDAGLDAVFSVGKFSHFISDECQGRHFADKSTLIAELTPLLAQHPSISILVKGSRSSAMEEVVHALQETIPC